MWKVQTPNGGNINEQLDSALIQHNGVADYTLTTQERDDIHELYALYDKVFGEPDPKLQAASLKGYVNALHTAYRQVQKGGRLASLRDTLLSAVMECPLCGSGSATTLDHHLPHNTYRALSINPRNLVPSCQPCNRLKGALSPVAGQGMIHAYFQALPQATFFKAEATYTAGTLEITFKIDNAELLVPLAERLSFQLERLKLNARYPDAINLFLFGLKPALEFFRRNPQERALLKTWLFKAGDTYDGDLGLNHWRAAVVRALAECDAFLDNPWDYLDRPSPAMRAAT